MGVTGALRAVDLYRFFHADDDEVLALRGVSLDVDGGEVVAITGPSGSGKSTLIACLAGLDEPDGGTVLVNGQQLTRRPEVTRTELRARHIGVLYQSANLVGHLNVRQNVELVRRLSRSASNARRRRDADDAGALLSRLGIGDRAESSPSHLSGGEAARAGLAVALANDPLVLLADEPTAEVDESTAAAVLWTLRVHADGGHAVVVATHSDAVASLADRVVHLVDGQVAA